MASNSSDSSTDGADSGPRPSRRGVLAAGVALTTGLAGCGGGSDPTPTGTPTDSPSPSPTDTPTSTPTASFPLVVEDFSADSLSGYSGAADEFTIVEEPTRSGGYALADETAYWGKGSAFRLAGDLPYAPRAGDTFRVSVYVTDSGEETRPFWGSFHWAIDEENGVVTTDEGRFNPFNCAILSFDTRGEFSTHEHGDMVFKLFSPELELNTPKQETVGAIEKPFPEGEWVDLEIDWGTDGGLDITLFDAGGNAFGTVSATDDIHESGGIGFRQGGSRGHTNVWDYVRITDRDRSG